jgi:hypothetical protein
MCLNTPEKRFLQLMQSHDKSKEYILKVERFALNVHLGSLKTTNTIWQALEAYHHVSLSYLP